MSSPNPRYRDGTVTLTTVDAGDATVEEPTWCRGHDDDSIGYLADLTHNGAPITAHAITAEHGPIDILEAYITHAPYAVQQPEPHPLLFIHIDVHGTFNPEDGRRLVQALRVAAVRLERATNQLAQLRGERR